MNKLIILIELKYKHKERHKTHKENQKNNGIAPIVTTKVNLLSYFYSSNW
jgi:hypothetical protein